MYNSFFKENEKFGNSSNFSAWKIKLEIIVEDNDGLEYIQGKVHESLENACIVAKNKYKKGELK